MITTSWRLFPINGVNLLCARRFATVQDPNITKFKQNIEKDILPSKPKRPLNIFMQYFVSIKDNLHKDNPNCMPKDIMKKAAEQWSQVDPAIKQNLQKQYVEEYSVYKQKLMDYKNSIIDDQQVLIKNKLSKKELALERNQVKQKLAELGKPKRPLTAFFLFLQDNKTIKDSQILQKDWVKHASKEWKNFTIEAKSKYIATAAQLSMKYKDEIKKWEENMVKEGHQDLLKSALKSKHDAKNEKDKK